MMNNLSNLTSQQWLQGGAGLIGAGLGVASAGQLGSMQQNAYTTAGNAANQLPFNTTSSSGMGAAFAPNSATINYGNMTGAQNQFAAFANQQSGIANSIGTQNPANVTQAGANAAQQNYQASGFNNNAQVAGNAVMNSGINQMYNPLIQQANTQAMNLMGSAGANYNSAYSTSLNSQLAALNPVIQQQSNALLNSNFERGQAGTSGGALNTQALQNSFNTADLQAQSNAVSQANALMGTTYNAANTASGIGTNQLAAGTNQYNVGQAALGSANQLGNYLGTSGLSTQQNLASFAPQLAGMYNTNAANATSAAGSINSQGLANANFGLAAGTNQGTQMNRAAATQGDIAHQYNGGTTGALGSAFSSLGGLLTGGNSSYSGLLGSIFNGLGSSGSNSAWNAINTPGTNGDVSGGIDYTGTPTDISNASYTQPVNYNQFSDPNYNPWGP